MPDDGSSLLEILRDHLFVRSPKDGCSPQGQCGCCTVWVDGAPRVSCVTPARRVAGREVTTLDGLDPELRARWAQAFLDTGASQCGFCTPGILMRLAALEARGKEVDAEAVGSALAAHLCRCTGWRSIYDAARLALARRDGSGDVPAPPLRDMRSAARRAELEGGSPQSVGLEVVLGRGGFADDTSPPGALVAVPDGRGGWAVAPTLAEARAAAGKVQGRNSTVGLRHPLPSPDGAFDLCLQTTFVEPAYLETDASWCVPAGEPATPLANGGAFGAKRGSPVTAVARRLAAQHGRPVRVVLAREDTVRLGPKRPPVAAGVRLDGTGSLLVATTPGSPPLEPWRAAFAAVLPEVDVEEVEVPGPPVSAELRAAGWAEAAVLDSALGLLRSGQAGQGRQVRDVPVTVSGPQGGRATVVLSSEGTVSVEIAAGAVLDETVLRSYVLGAVHQGLGWVWREGIAVDEQGEILDLTVRSFGVLPARDMPPVAVAMVDDAGAEPVAVGDAVLVATATAAWLAAGLVPKWPVERSRQS